MPDNRAALLRGARQRLDERGYARTRARDVASAASVSTAAIGYHFGTIDALLVEALLEGLEEWSAELDQLFADLPEQGLSAHVADVYRCVVGSFAAYRGVLAASFELIARADDNVEVRDRLRDVVAGARDYLAHQVLRGTPDVEPDPGGVVSTACYAMLSGLIVQWLVDPESLPGPEVVARQLEALTRSAK